MDLLFWIGCLLFLGGIVLLKLIVGTNLHMRIFARYEQEKAQEELSAE